MIRAGGIGVNQTPEIDVRARENTLNDIIDDDTAAVLYPYIVHDDHDVMNIHDSNFTYVLSMCICAESVQHCCLSYRETRGGARDNASWALVIIHAQHDRAGAWQRVIVYCCVLYSMKH